MVLFQNWIFIVKFLLMFSNVELSFAKYLYKLVLIWWSLKANIRLYYYEEIRYNFEPKGYWGSDTDDQGSEDVELSGSLQVEPHIALCEASV